MENLFIELRVGKKFSGLSIDFTTFISDKDYWHFRYKENGVSLIIKKSDVLIIQINE